MLQFECQTTSVHAKAYGYGEVRAEDDDWECFVSEDDSLCEYKLPLT